MSRITIAALDRAMKEADPLTERHGKRMREPSLLLGRALDLSESDLGLVALLAAFHDVGKVAIPRSVLTKRGRLTRTEWALIRQHPLTGFDFARQTDELAPIAGAILAHHERWDGAGYPYRLRGEGIPLLARLIAITDAFDAMMCGRPYREPMTLEESLAELSGCAGSQFDPDMVRAFLAVLRGDPPTEGSRGAGTGHMPYGGELR